MKISGVLLVQSLVWVCIFAESDGEKVEGGKVRVVAGGRTIKLASTPDIVALKDENVRHASSPPIDTEPLPSPQPFVSLTPAESQLLPEPLLPVVGEPGVKTDLEVEPSLYYGPYVKYGFPIPYGHHHHRYAHFGKNFGIRLGPFGLGLGFGLGTHYSFGYPGLFGFHKGFHKSFHFFG
ncbi:unnamed protein product [Allacma fusca]|uniref:Uncharacterized protein n=1 Tax=Allacma fusca TaxID=39272 RepID=A0A8J2KUR7_9HEXA|nr:unnamed protein product [Allacma fusca]